MSLQGESVDRALSEYGLGLEYEVRPTPELGLVAGAMYHRLSGQGRDDGAAGGSIGAALDLAPRARLRASVGHRFRFPALRQLFDARGGNTTLEVERADVYELGADYQIVRGATLGLTAFRSDARDFIERSETTDLFQNAERYLMQGLELELSVRPGRRVLARARYTYLDAEDRTPGREGRRLQYRPAHLIAGELRYAADWGLAASATVQYVADQVYQTRRAPLVQAGLPDFALIGLRLEQRVETTPVSLFAGVDNLFGAAYEQSYGFPQEGRVVYLGADLRR